MKRVRHYSGYYSTYRWCAVPECKNTSVKTPDKLWFQVPTNLDMRTTWFKVARRDLELLTKKSRLHFCEDHFDLEKDMENYTQYKIMGSVKRIQLNPHCIPSRFNWNRKHKSASNESHLAEDKRRRISISKDFVEDHKEEDTKEVKDLESIEVEVKIENETDDEAGSASRSQTPVDEELWVVRKQLCRGCHSDGAFWSLQTTTEGVAYGDLLQTYFNIQLCPVSEDEHALSAICALCAARLREARAFSAQARASEERFTLFYKQNRIRALVDDVGIKEDVTKIKIEVDHFETTDDVEPHTANSNFTVFRDVEIKEDGPKIKNEVIEFEITNDVEPGTANSNLSKSESSTDELAPTINKDKKTQVRSEKTSFHLSPSDYQRVGKSFKCTRCDKLFSNRKGIHNHVKYIHFKSTKHTLSCSRCGKTFKKPSDYNSHKKKDHCIIYKEKSRKGYELSQSDFERVGDSYKCTRCEKLFKDIKAVRYHVMYIHLKLPRYPCPYCDQTFKLLGPFNKHKLDEHSIDHRIKCNACDAIFNRSSQLTKHKNNFHMLGIQQTCPSPNCDYVSFSQENLRRHFVSHSTVREHHCKYCKKSFLRKNNLIEHEKIHTQDKRKVCNVCGQAFVQRASLTYHMAKHHPEVRL